MKKIVFLFSALAIITHANAQKKLKQFVNTNSVAITTVEPDSVNYNDLELIGKSIGNAKVVMLGEQDHGDAPTFLAKTRLIKYLHEKMGFNVLAFESDFFGLNVGFDKIEKSEPVIDTFIKRNIFPIWTYCNTCQDLFYKYIPSTYKTETPLKLTGFDSQFVLNHSFRHLGAYVDSLLHSLDAPIAKQENYKSEILPLIDSMKFYYLKDKSNYAKRGVFLNEIKEQAGKKLEKNSFEMQVLDNIIEANKQYEQGKGNFILANNIRDERMALNLQWLSTIKFPTEKIIVWAANAHVAKYTDSTAKYNNVFTTMGYFFTNNEAFRNSTYVLGFTSYEGEAGRLWFNTYNVRKPKSDGFENWINKAYDYAFIDFNTYHKTYAGESENFYLKALGHNTAFKRDWTKVFDGIFFIRHMYPCKR